MVRTLSRVSFSDLRIETSLLWKFISSYMVLIISYGWVNEWGTWTNLKVHELSLQGRWVARDAALGLVESSCFAVAVAALHWTFGLNSYIFWV